MGRLASLGKLMFEQPLDFAGKAASAGGRGVSAMGRSPLALGTVAAGAFGLGMANTVLPAARDAALEISMGDPNADVAFTGRKMDASFLAGRYMGGAASTIGDVMNPIDFASTGTPMAAGINAMASPAGLAGGVAAAGAGGALGGFGGYKLGRAIGKKNLVGGLIGGAIGTAMGMSIGATAGPVAMGAGVAGHVKNNQRFYSESPYVRNSSLSNALALNASGDIVLGMHNARRGY